MSAHPARRLHRLHRLRHGPWIVALPAAVVCGYLLDGAFRRVRSRQTGPRLSSVLPVDVPPPTRTAPPARTAVGRNIFCSRCTAGERPTPTPAAASTVADLRLLATLLGERPEHGHFAVVAAADGVALLAVGTAIDAHRRLLRVAARHAVIDTPAGPARLELLGDDDPMPVAGPPSARRGLASSPSGITPLGAHRYRIAAELRDALLADPAAALRCGRVLPRADGLHLRGIRPRCLWWALGLRGGDVLQAINGRRLSPEMALQLMVKLRHASRLTVAVERRGRPLTLEYEIGR